MSEFNFPEMTPDLRTYLDHGSERPHYKYPEKNRGKPTPESQAAVDAWKAARKALLGKLPDGLLDAYYAAKKVWLCRDETQNGDQKVVMSPCGDFHFVLTRHTTGKGTWDYSRAKVFAHNEQITTVYRNYGAFPFAWVLNHPNGHKYLVCGEDYQGQTVIELDTGKRVDFLPSAASQGFGFCWAAINPSPDGSLLAVEGCYWAAPYEVIIVDFTDPMNPPWLILDRDEDDDFDGWEDDNTCRIGRSFEVVDLPGHPLHGKSENDCTLEELETVEKEAAERGLEETDYVEAGWKMVKETHQWSRPDNLEMCKKWVSSIVPWRIKMGGGLHPDHAVQFKLIHDRLTEKEKFLMFDDDQLGPMFHKAIHWAENPLSEDD